MITHSFLSKLEFCHLIIVENDFFKKKETGAYSDMVRRFQVFENVL